MAAPIRTDVAPLDAHPHRLSDNVRFADLDVNRHVNNAVYSSYFETSRVLLVGQPENGLTPEGLGWVLARLDISFRAELHWPGTFELGLGVLRLGRTSVTFSQVVYSKGRCMASAQATTVMVDSASRKPTPLPEDVVAAFGKWMLRDG